MKVSWDSLHSMIEECQSCPLCREIHHKVPGQGNPHARLMLIGEGPGFEEDRSGLAFVGPAGQLLTRMLESIGLTREEVYICNIVKCRPPRNRVPEPEEATAGRYTLGESFRVTRDRGRFVEKSGIWFMPTYHPSALLRDETGQKKREAWHDLQAVRDRLAELGQQE